MGLKGLMSGMGMNVFATWALLLFMAAFIAIVVWTYTRPRKEIESQANLPLEGDGTAKDQKE
jgi:cbb3-type cytochrome oxidase subunit 3